MKLQLEVLASSSIKRTKSWPKIVWVGEEHESLLLLDNVDHRVSVLYVPSGKTKKKIPRLSPLIQDTLVISTTRSGSFLVGLMRQGDLFIWNKDKDILKTIRGLAGVVTSQLLQDENCQLFASNDCHHILLTVGTQGLYVWKIEQSDIFTSKVPEVHGSWNKVALPQDVHIPSFTEESPEGSLDAVFFSHQSLGHCCLVSYVFNKTDHVCVVTAFLKFGEPSELYNQNAPAFLVEWTSIEYPFKHIHPSYKPIQSKGASVCSYSNSGQVIAVAANQNVPGHSSMMFVSPLTDTVLVAGLKGCGVSDPYSTMGRMYWVDSMAWTYDDLFVTCIMKSGAVCVLTRLGEPLVIYTVGSNMEIGPAYYLPLHPKQYVSHARNDTADNRLGDTDSSEMDPFKQRLSVSTHPTLPIILYSDGFMVTIVQLPAEMTCLSLMRDYVLLSSKHLKEITKQQNLDLTLADAYSMPSSREEKSARQGLHQKDRKKKPFHFEVPDSNLNLTQESETSLLESRKDMLQGLTEGKISFAETAIPVVDPTDLSGLDTIGLSARRLDIAEDCILTAWKLAVSYHGHWMSDMESVTKLTCQNLTKLFSVMLDCPGMEDILSNYRHTMSAAQNPRLFSVIDIYRKTIELLRFDIVNQHLMPVALRFCYHSLNLVLNSKELQVTDPRLKTLSGCFTLMKFTETKLNQFYVWIPREVAYSKEPQSSTDQRHIYEPAILVKSQMSPQSVAKQISSKDQQSAKGVVLDQQDQLPSKRLCGSWKLLYKNLLIHQNQLKQGGVDDKQMEQLNSLLIAVQHTLQGVDGDLPKISPSQVSQGDKLSLDGMHTMAVDAWTDQLDKITHESNGVQHAAKVYHSILYTHILKKELFKAVDFVDSLVVQSNVLSKDSSGQFEQNKDKLSLMTIVTNTLKTQQSSEDDQLVPCIHDRAIRQLVQTMARFMAAYFTNQTVYVYPPHNPQTLPVIHMGPVKITNRIIPCYHEDITNIVRKTGLSRIWTTERTLEYLLLSGLVCEAVWFADKMGDWKAAFLLSVACSCHHGVAPRLYKKSKKPLVLPEELTPHTILQGKLQALIHLDRRKTGATVQRDKQRDFIPIDNDTNIVQLTKTVEDIIVAGILSDVEVVPWLLSGLVEKLKNIVSNLTPLVPKDFYLPAPPLYCSQPSESAQDTGGSAEMEQEKKLRFQISSLVQLILVVFTASHTSIPAARWYTQELAKAQGKAKQFKATTEGPCLELPEVLQQYQASKSHLSRLRKEKSVQRVLISFRDFCTIMWLLHSRDKLSRNLRQREEYMNNVKYEDYVRASWDSKEGDKWIKKCFNNLQWAVHMLSFSRFLPDEACIYKIILSLIQELPPKEDTADILAEYFYDNENLDAEVQEKLDKVLAIWQGVFIEPEDDGKSARPLDDNDDENEGRKSVTFLQVSPRGKILSVYYFKQCDVVTKVLKKKRKVFGGYEEFVYDHSGKISVVDSLNGSSHKNNKHSVGCRPFETKTSYLEFLDNFFAICFTKLLDKDNTRVHNKDSLPLLKPYFEEICSFQFRDISQQFGKDRQRKQRLVVMTSSTQKVFERSQSESHVHSSGQVLTPGTTKGMYRSVSTGEPSRHRDDSPSNKSYRDSPKGKMTGLASKFSQSEDVLYKGPTVEEEVVWSMNVDFGQKYHHLQNLLDWLSEWGRKNHSLGLKQQGEKDLEFRPTMKIDVPPSLVVLSLWLLENKYSPSKKVQRSGHHSSRTVTPDVQNLSVIEEDASHRSALEEVPEPQIVEEAIIVPVKKKCSKNMKGKPPYLQQEVQHNMSSSLKSFTSQHSMENEYDQETEDVHSAYERVLDEHKEESSSLEVSSLGTDEYDQELKNTLSVIKGSSKLGSSRRKGTDKSPSPSRENTYFNRMRNFNSPDRSHTRSPKSSTTNTRRSRQRTRSRERQDAQHQGGLGTNVAHQLQDIVRSELRKMMQVQHMSMMAMMGALDNADVQNINLPFQMQPQAPVRSQQRSQGTSPIRADGSVRNTMMIEELEESARPRKGRKNSSMRGALNELKNLQDSTVRKPSQSPGGRSRKSPGLASGKENMDQSTLHMSHLQSREASNMAKKVQETEEVYHVQQQANEPIHFIPKFLRIPAEKDTSGVKLPHIPAKAWTERHENEYEPKQEENLQIPLLNVHGVNAPSKLFPGVHQFPGDQMPYLPPQQYQTLYGAQPQYDHQMPIMGFSQHSFEANDASKFGIPLLQIPKETKPFLGPQPEPTFGRLLAPHLIIGSEQERHQREVTKQKYAREFHRLQVEDLEELEKQRFGQNLLKVNLQFQELKERKEDEIQERKIVKKKKKKREFKVESQTESESDKVLKEVRSRTPSPRRKVTTPSTEREEEQVEEPLDDEELEDESIEEEETEEDEEAEKESRFHDGYAIRQGAFDNYLPMAERLGPEADTNARVQYRTAMILKKQREKRKKVDFATMTTDHADAQIETDIAMEMESVRTAEAATSITKDTGVDPIQEAIVEYNLARQGNVLPPDIYLGLRFGDAEGQPTSDVTAESGQEKPKGRSYLNVVDLDASMVLKDLRAIREEEKVQEDLGFKPSSETMMSAHNRQEAGEIRAYEEFVRQSMEPRPGEKKFWQDAVTVKMFEQKGRTDADDKISVALMPRESLHGSRAAVISRLRDMNSQMLAIDQMSQNIEGDFKRTHLMLDTLETLAGVDQPLKPEEEGDRFSRSHTPSPKRTRSPSPKTRPQTRSPSPKAASLRGSGKSDSLAPVISEKTPSVSARTTARTARSDLRRSPADLVKVSGLSGISDIIGDMVQRGEIDFEEAGFTPQEAEMFANRAKFSGQTVNDQDRIKKSLEMLEKMGKKVMVDEEEKIKKEENREQLKAWMAEKRMSRMEEYRKQLSELREHEHHPFKANLDSSFKGPAKDLEKDRMYKGSKYMQQRLQEAQNLMSDIVTDKPKLPVQKDVRQFSPKRKPFTQDQSASPKKRTVTLSPTRTEREISPKRQTVTISPAAPQTRGYIPEATPKQSHKKTVSLKAVSKILNVRPVREDSPPEDEGPSSLTFIPKLRLVDSGELGKTAETTGEISAYAKAVQEMEVTGSQDMWTDQRASSPPGGAARPYKPKPYTELVKVQRPEVTRKKPTFTSPYISSRQVDVGRDERKDSTRDISAREGRTGELTLEEKQRIHGSKRLPGTSKIPLAVHRNVKTYTERLQEMKSGPRTYNKPIVPRSRAGSSVRSSTYTQSLPRKKTGPPHKPLTYVQQLQKLNAGAHRPKPRGAAARVKPATFMKSHKPLHKPMTYAEQLQSLQPKPKVHRISPARGDTRMRPYADPYRGHDDAESIISEWSVDDNVRKLLYEDEASTTAYGMSVMEYPMSEGISDYYDVVMGSSEYLGSVDITEIEQIADAASVSEGSVMSVIDWDAVDNLIYDSNI